MNTTEFIDRLYNLSTSYHWTVDSDNKVVATIRVDQTEGLTLNPVTAFAHKSGFGIYDNTRDGTEHAASHWIPRTTARKIYSATLGTSNRGNTQVVRGKIRSALEV